MMFEHLDLIFHVDDKDDLLCSFIYMCVANHMT